MKEMLVGLLLAFTLPHGDARMPFEGTESTVSMTLSIDVSCILKSWKIIGVLACPTLAGGVNTCLIVENAYPVGILEAVRQPYASHLVEASAFFAPFKELPRYGSTSSHTNGSGDGTRLQFAEAHAFTFIPDLLIDSALPLAKPRGEPFGLSYLSELDGFFWRTGIAEMVMNPVESLERAVLPACSTVPRIGDCAGTWGPWSPRIGFTVHPSEVIASYLASLRGGRVGASGMGRVVLSRYPYEPRTGHYIQMVRPARRSCVSIGWPVVREIERGALSRNGAYLFIHLGVFRECRGCFSPRLAEPRPPTG